MTAMATDNKNIFDIDLYELFGINSDCSTQEVKKAYRKKALSCHPDKNPDNPKAAELFHELSKALEILIDKSARAAYDKVLTGRRAAKIRHRELDSRRKKLKEDLEARERAAAKSSTHQEYGDIRSDEAKLQAQIERLRKEGSKELAEEIALIKRQVEEERKSGIRTNEVLQDASHSYRLKIRWHTSKDDVDNAGYNYETLRKILSKYGDIVALIISKKKGSAMVEFETKDAASMAHELEKGLINNPLTVEYIDGAGPKAKQQSSSTESAPTLISDTDFESLVLRRMRQAEERKRLIEEISEEDGP